MPLRSAFIDKIGLFVKDYSRSVLFYKNNLELIPVWESEADSNAAFRVGHNLLIIQASPDKVQPGGARLYFTVVDARGLRDELIGKGVACDAAQDLGFGVFVDFTDPDGNRLALFQPSPAYLPEMEKYLGRKVF
jgi:catechol 2,3-dioxygenase-like lactoylglutathione lyase family enzyme